MKLNAVGVTSSNLKKTLLFYSLLGFKFPKIMKKDQHIESITNGSSAKLMIDEKRVVKEIIGENPKPGNHSTFAIEYKNAKEVNSTVNKIKKAGFKIVKDPWDAFWNQRYAIVEDPDGYRVDLYAELKKASP